MSKVTVVGAGNVGATVANVLIFHGTATATAKSIRNDLTKFFILLSFLKKYSISLQR